MKNLGQKITVAAGLILSLGLASCQKEDVVTPNQSPIASGRIASDEITPNLHVKYRLTKFGRANLTYYPDGRLKQVTAGGNLRGNGVSYRREYTYDANRIIFATTYLDGKIILMDTYYLDEQTGLCHRSEQVDYSYLYHPVANPQINSQWYYQYNTEGQLVRVQNLLNSENRVEYNYNAGADLTGITVYDAATGKNGVVTQTLALTYNQSPLVRGAGNSLDKYPINYSWVRLPVPDESFQSQQVPEQHLKIFGKPSRHLVMKVVHMKPNSTQPLLNSLFTYQVDSDGFVTERKEFDAHGSLLIETKSYEY